MHIPEARQTPIDSLITDPDNPNEMTEQQLDALTEAIKTYGFAVPVITDRNLRVADGHQRLMAARKLGMTHVSVIQLDIDEPNRLIVQQIMNKMRGQHRPERDALAFKKIFEAERLPQLAGLLAMRENRLVSLMNKYQEPKIKGDLDAVPLVDPAYVATIKPGDVFQLGRHRLMCGDSTKGETYQLLLQGETADMVFTDPPYGVSYQGDTVEGVMANDNLRDESLQQFLFSCFNLVALHTKADVPVYVFYASKNHIEFEKALNFAGFRVKEQLIWDKIYLVLGHADYHWSHEPCLYACKTGQNCTWYGDRAQRTMFFNSTLPELKNLTKDELIAIIHTIHEESTVWHVKRDNPRDYIHATQKPVALPMKAIKNSSRPGAVVLEPFNGSGSTLIACEATGRSCRAIDIDPANIAKTIKRWEKLTGQAAVRISTG